MNIRNFNSWKGTLVLEEPDLRAGPRILDIL